MTRKTRYISPVLVSLAFALIDGHAKAELSNPDPVPLASPESCKIYPRSSRMYVRVFEESPDNSRGSLLFSGWLDREERRTIQLSERGRIIFEYKYADWEAFNTEVHAWCLRGDPVSLP